MEVYLFRTGAVRYIACARNIEEAVRKFFRSLVSGELPDGSALGLVVEVLKLSEKTGEPVGRPFYCFTPPFLVAAGLLSFREFAELLKSLKMDDKDASTLVEIAKRLLLSKK